MPIDDLCCVLPMSYLSSLPLMITDHIYHLFIVLWYMPTVIGVIMYACFNTVLYCCLFPLYKSNLFGCYENTANIILIIIIMCYYSSSTWVNFLLSYEYQWSAVRMCFCCSEPPITAWLVNGNHTLLCTYLVSNWFRIGFYENCYNQHVI